MKTRLRLISLLLCLILTLISLVSCGGNTAETDAKDTTPSDTLDDSQNSLINEDEVLVLFKDGAYTSKFLIPDIASSSEKSVYVKLRSAMKEKTKIDVPYTTDILPAGETRDPNETAVILGNTNYDESKQATENANYGDYSLKIIGNKVVLSFTSKDDGIDLVNILSKAIKTDDNGCFWIERSFSVSKQGLPQLNGLPKYPATDTTLVDCRDSTSMIVAHRTTLDEFRSYCTAIEQAGFTLDSSRDNVNGNYFRTYVKGGLAVTAYFAPSSKSARIIAGPATDIPSKEVDTTPETVSPSLTLLSQNERMNNGLGMLYLLPNGKFLIIDGGYVRSAQLYDIIHKLAPNKQEIVITAWYISHPHGDHQQALTSFLRSNYKNVKIESILYNYTTSDQYNSVTTGSDGASSAISLETNLTKYLKSDTKVIKPHTGQIYRYGSTTVEIMYTVEDVLPQTLDYLNTSSLVVRVTVGDHTLMALADTTHVSGDILRNMYGAYLESDMVQLAHHGTHPGYASLYHAIKAPVLLWPSNMSNVKAQFTNSAVVAAVSYASDIYVANSGMVTLNLPYTPINNKQQLIESLGGT